MTTHRSIKKEVLLIRGEVSEAVEQSVVREVPLTIFLNGDELVTLLTTGEACRELAVGFLLSEGLLKNREELLSARVDESAGEAHVRVSGDPAAGERFRTGRTVTSGGGRGITFHRFRDSLAAVDSNPAQPVPVSRIPALMEDLDRRSVLYRQTGGVHNSALSDREKILLFRDDIGRHNAVDKIHGAAFLKNMPMGDKLLLTSGRISSEMVVKAVRMGVPILVSRSAPTSLAVDLARMAGLILVGYARGSSMTVYAGEQRIAGGT